MSDWAFAGLGIIVISTLFCLTSIYAVRPQVNINASPGLRTPETMRSKEAWLAAHTRLQPTLWWTGLAGVALGTVFIIWGATSGSGSAELALVVPMLGLAAATVRIYRVGTRAAKAA